MQDEPPEENTLLKGEPPKSNITPFNSAQERIKRKAELFLKNARGGEELAQKLTPPAILMWQYGIIPGRPTALVAYGGVGKTWVACDLAIALAAPRPWGGTTWGIDSEEMLAERGANVLHIDYEMGIDIITKRYQRLAYGRKVNLALFGKRIQVVSFPPMHLATPGTDLEPAFMEICKGIRLCIIDSFRAAVPGVDENSSESRKYLDMLTHVSDKTGTVFLVLFHENKPNVAGDRARKFSMRGSSALFDACGSVLSVSQDNSVLTIDHEKSSFGPMYQRVYCKLVDVGDDDFGEWYQSEGVKLLAVDEHEIERKRAAKKEKNHVQITPLARIKQQVLEVLKKKEMTAMELRSALTGSQALRLQAILDLERTGEITASKKGHERLYRITWKSPKK